MIDKNAGKLPTQNIDLKLLETEFYSPSSQPLKVKFGTSGHRGMLGAGFCALHAKAIAQAVAKLHIEGNIKGKILVGGDTRLMSKVTSELCACVIAGNGLEVLLPCIPVPTPVFSFEILSKHCVASLNGTASHNPPQDMGLKYNPANGGPADSAITSKIETYANYFIEHPSEIKFISLEEAKIKKLVCIPNIVENYVKVLGEKINFKIIKSAGLKVALHPMGGTSLPFMQAIKEKYQLNNVEIVSELQNPSFNFIPLDHDGKTRMDPSSKYPMSPLIDLVLGGKYDFAGACDPDADRFGAATSKGGLLPPNHALCVMFNYLVSKNESAKADSVGRTIGTTHLMDRIAAANNFKVDEVNVGFKYFVDGLSDGRLIMAGEESAGMSVANWVTEKDGILAVFLLLEIMSATGQDIAGLYKQLTELYGNPVYTRIDMPVTEEVKAELKNITKESLRNLREIAGEKVLKVRDSDGVKVYLEESWFLVRPSGTEAIVKFYVETFKGEEHLKRIIEEGKKVFGI